MKVPFQERWARENNSKRLRIGSISTRILTLHNIYYLTK